MVRAGRPLHRGALRQTIQPGKCVSAQRPPGAHKQRMVAVAASATSMACPSPDKVNARAETQFHACFADCLPGGEPSRKGGPRRSTRREARKYKMRVLSPDGEGTQRGGNNRWRRDRRSAAAKSRKVAANSKSAGIGSESDQRKSLTDEAKSRGEPRRSRRELADVLEKKQVGKMFLKRRIYPAVHRQRRPTA